MKSFIIAALLFIGIVASAQDRFYYSQEQYDHLIRHEQGTIFSGGLKPSMPISVDGMLYTRCISEDGHDAKYKEWIEQYPDGYEVYCGPCVIKPNDHEAVEQTVYTKKAYESFASDSPFTMRAIGWSVDTIKCVMLISELGGPAKHQNGYGVIKGWSRLKYLDANKIEVKGFVWLSKEEEWKE